MNERMFELLAEARDITVEQCVKAPHGSALLTPTQLEKFAELIRAEHTQSVIQLCARTINDNLNAEKQRHSNRRDIINLFLIIVGMIAWITFWYTQFHMV
jgi:hypothetical protein